MFLPRKQTVWRITFFLILITLVAIAVALMLYYPYIYTLNSHQGYKGIFI